MLLRNFWEWFRCVTNEVLTIGGNSAYGMPTSIKYMSWTEGNDKPYLYGMRMPTNGMTNTYNVNNVFPNIIRVLHVHGVCVGTGTTPVTAEDYKLDNQVNLSNSTFSAIPSVNADGKVALVVSWSGSNLTDSDITITEIGIIHNFNMCSASSLNYSTIQTQAPDVGVLIARHILETPVTIAPGNTGSITINLTLF